MSEQDGVPPARQGLPLISIRAHGIYLPEPENDRPFHAPYPKVVPARWLIDVGRRLGVRDEQLVFVPDGLDHEKYRVINPIAGRGARIAMVHNNNRTKGSRFGLRALAMVRDAMPEVEATVFSQVEPRNKIPPGVIFRHDPPQREIVEEIYNRSAIFISPSIVEGFGLPCIEAMACGCALVTTENGGSREYAIDGETALVRPPKDSQALVNSIVKLMRNEDQRADLARRGCEYVKRFDWDTSAEILERFLMTYEAAPARYMG